MLDRIAGGCEVTMESFYRNYAGAVYQFAFRTLGNTADAEEVVNEVMMEVWRKADSFAGRSRIKTWLLSITHNKAVDAVRRKVRHDADEWDPDAAIDANVCTLTDLKASTENRQHVEECMGRLNDGQRQVVYLTFFEELSYPEISIVLAVPAGTIKTRMLHARKLLKRCLALLRGEEVN